VNVSAQLAVARVTDQLSRNIRRKFDSRELGRLEWLESLASNFSKSTEA